MALRYSCDTRAPRARRDYKPRGPALREESTSFPTKNTQIAPLIADKALTGQL